MRTTFPEELERARVKSPENRMYASDPGDRFGLFSLRLGDFLNAVIIASDGMPEAGVSWEHVSVHVRKLARTRGGKMKVIARRTPTWEEMCRIKDLFWNEEETVVQYHPPKSEYVNVADYCLHLWRPTDTEIPRPPQFCV